MNSVFNSLVFGTAGVALSPSIAPTLSAIKQLKELGLSCLEIEMMHGVRFSMEMAAAIRRQAEEQNIFLSFHAPYSINLLSPDQGKRLSSQKQLLSSARWANLCGARNLVFHGGFYAGNSPEKDLEVIRASLQNILSLLQAEKNRIILRLETMGKKSQFGTLEEVLLLCQEIEGLEPCLDFAHLYSREGKANGYRHFLRTIKKVGKKLGSKAWQNMHIHVSGVHFLAKGEVKHLNLRETDFRWEELLMALGDSGVAGVVI